MGLVASLDIGSEKTVMALANADSGPCRLMGIKIAASQGVQRGIVKDKDRMRAVVSNLMAELSKDRQIDKLNIAVSGDALQMCERKVSISLKRKIVEQQDLYLAEQKCSELFEGGRDELIDIIPVAYSVDRDELIADPIGKQGRFLEATYQVYTAPCDYISMLRSVFDKMGVGEICFFPVTRAYCEALDVERNRNDFAMIDFGAMNISVLLFREGLLEFEARLPLGVRTIDNDIAMAFAIDALQARKLKHEYAQALRSACKNKKLTIPDTRLTIESRDLAMVVQSRAEELLEGAVYRLQRWEFDNPSEEILITGGGSRLQDMDILLARMSAHPVMKAKARRIQVSKDEILTTPEYFVALGLLLCKHQDVQVSGGGFMEKLKNFFS